MDALVVGDALAARYARGTLTPPTGYAAVRASTCRPPNRIPSSPWVLVVLPTGTGDAGSQGSGTVDYVSEWHVLFHYERASGDKARDWKALLSWLGVLLNATYGQMKLGLSATQGVRKAVPVRWDQVLLRYAGIEYYGWDITVKVWSQDQVTFTP